MKAKDFLKLGKRDFSNGAVTDEIYKDLKEKERLELENQELKFKIEAIVKAIKEHSAI